MAPRALRPFAHRDYRTLMAALVASIFAHGMWAVAMVYEVRHLGGGPLELSYVATATSVGLLAFVLAGGIAADRFSCRRIIILVEGASVAVMSVLAALSVTGAAQLWHVAAAGFVQGVGMAFFFPAYSALLPRILPGEDLLAANGMEGTVRPVLQMAAGPAAAGMVVAASAPAWAIVGIAACHAVALVVLNTIHRDPRYEAHDGSDGERPGVLADLREGVLYTLRTPWLLWTLLFAVVSVLGFMGPFEVLLPFAVSENLGGDARTFGFLLAAYGVGSALGSLATASVRLPRRYLTVMMGVWAFGWAPIAVLGFATEFWLMAGTLLVVGTAGGIGQVIWGTLLQRRVPTRMLGRVSSLDFFVSLALMPVSMALAGPVGEVVPLWIVFLVAGAVPVAAGVVAWLAGRMYRDEIANPLDRVPEQQQAGR